MQMPTEIPNDNYDEVMAYLRSELNSSEKNSRLYAEATLSSGSTDENENFRFKPVKEAWCPYGVTFSLNPDPDIEDPEYPLNKASIAWNDSKHSIYSNSSDGILDGEFIDSLETRSTVLDYRKSHIAATDLPLVYDSTDLLPSVPLIFATYEFVRWVEKDKIGRASCRERV